MHFGHKLEMDGKGSETYRVGGALPIQDTSLRAAFLVEIDEPCFQWDTDFCKVIFAKGVLVPDDELEDTELVREACR